MCSRPGLRGAAGQRTLSPAAQGALGGAFGNLGVRGGVEPSGTAPAAGDRSAASGIGVFVCYRRDDTAGFARALKTVLDERYGEDRVFMDLDSIAPGQRWEDVINDAVGSCHAFMALIGPEWLTIKDAEGRARLWNPQDPVRLEIEAAIRENLLLIPVLLEGARVPTKEELPDGLAALPETQALTITDDWDAGVAKLVKALDAVVRGSMAVEASITPEPAGEDPTDPGSRSDGAADATDETETEPKRAGTVEPERPRRTLRTVLIAGLVALAVIGVAVAVAASRHGPTAAPTSPAAANGHGPTVAPISPTVGASLNPSASEIAVHDYLLNVYNLLQQSREQRDQIRDAIKAKNAPALMALQKRRQGLLDKVQTWSVPPEAAGMNNALVVVFRDAVTNVGYWIDYASDKGTYADAEKYQNETVRPAKAAVVASYNELRKTVSDPPPGLDDGFLF